LHLDLCGDQVTFGGGTWTADANVLAWVRVGNDLVDAGWILVAEAAKRLVDNLEELARNILNVGLGGWGAWMELRKERRVIRRVGWKQKVGRLLSAYRCGSLLQTLVAGGLQVITSGISREHVVSDVIQDF
jgi:hypothetical protein